MVVDRNNKPLEDALPSPSPNAHTVKWVVGLAYGGQAVHSKGMTELDRHTNMIYVGDQARIMQQTGQFAYANTFTKNVAVMLKVSSLMPWWHTTAPTLTTSSYLLPVILFM